MRLYPEERLRIVVLANGTDLDYDGVARPARIAGVVRVVLSNIAVYRHLVWIVRCRVHVVLRSQGAGWQTASGRYTAIVL
jgi:hypothetical protein